MGIQLDDVACWAGEWNMTGEPIIERIARKIAEYWYMEDGALAAFAWGECVNGDELRDDIEGVICYAKSTGIFVATIHELYALKDWVLHQNAMGV